MSEDLQYRAFFCKKCGKLFGGHHISISKSKDIKAWISTNEDHTKMYEMTYDAFMSEDLCSCNIQPLLASDSTSQTEIVEVKELKFRGIQKCQILGEL